MDDKSHPDGKPADSTDDRLVPNKFLDNTPSDVLDSNEPAEAQKP